MMAQIASGGSLSSLMVGPTRVDGLVEVQARSLRLKITATNPRADGAPKDRRASDLPYLSFP